MNFFVNNNNSFLLFSITTSIVVITSIIEWSVSIFIFYIILFVIGYFLTVFLNNSKVNINCYILVFSISVIYTIVLYYAYTLRYDLPYFIGGSDDLAYELEGKAISSVWLYDSEEIGKILNKPWHNSKGYIYVVSLIYRIGEFLWGFHTLMPRFLNSLGLGVIFSLIYNLSLKINLKKKEAIKVGLVVSLFPIMLYTGAHTFRDIIVAVIIILSVITGINITLKGGRPALWNSAILLLLGLVLTQFRLLQITAIAGILLTAWYIRLSDFINKRVFWVLTSIVIVLVVVEWNNIKETSEILITAEQTIDRYQETLSERSEGLSQQLFEFEFPLNVVGRFGYSAVAPLPIISPHFERTILSIGTIFQYFFFPYIFFGVYSLVKNKQTWPLLVGFAILYFGYAFGSFTFRHLAQVIPFGILSAFIGFKNYKKIRLPIFIIMLIILIISFLIYIILKNYI